MDNDTMIVLEVLNTLNFNYKVKFEKDFGRILIPSNNNSQAGVEIIFDKDDKNIEEVDYLTVEEWEKIF